SAQVGDRVYLATDTALVGVRGRDLSEVPSIRVHARIVALAPTPSGDRIYLAIAGDSSLSVVDRYTDRIASTVQLPGDVAALRMDGLGRYVLVRPTRGDSAWVIAVATNRVVGSVRTKWTDDLPATAPDGAIALNSGRDVIFVDGETLQPVRTVAGGANDFWYFTFWNGFRARAPGVDQPVTFASADTTTADSAAAPPVDSAARVAAATATKAEPRAPAAATAATAATGSAPTAPRPPAPSPTMPPAPTASAAAPFTVSFAALLNEAKAHALADSIDVGGARARVVPSQRAGTTIYRVVLGPYPNRVAAEQVGRDSKRSYWVFPGQP
ncbi:MAG: SPOR domain-containing protein, partial [Gemmatimonadaceae bacterium]